MQKLDPHQPTVAEIRQALSSADPLQIRVALIVIWLTCSRVGEIVAYKDPGDRTAHPTGAKLSARLETYKPNIKNPKEREALVLNAAAQGKIFDPVEAAKIQEEALVFSVLVEKRDYQKEQDGSLTHTWIKECAIPTNPDYEPFSQIVLKYLDQWPGGELPLFPLTRGELWPEARRVFDGFTYTIQPYKRAKKDLEGKYVYADQKLATELQPEKEKAAALQAIRHWRKENLENDFGFNDKELNAFGGWTSRGSEANRARDRYSKFSWRIYFPKLLTPLEV